MDEDLENAMAPMVDALTGAMAAVLLISIFLMLSSMQKASSSIKEYGRQSLYKSEGLIADVFNRNPPVLNLKEKQLIFFKTYKLLPEQLEQLKIEFQTIPKKISIYTDANDDMTTFHILQFLSETGLQKDIDKIELDFQPGRKGNLTEFIWE
ncbi:MAG: hypothetical protein ACRC24_03560 [Vibrionaceae bacterium]